MGMNGTFAVYCYMYPMNLLILPQGVTVCPFLSLTCSVNAAVSLKILSLYCFEPPKQNIYTFNKALHPGKSKVGYIF